jgi:predicted nucleic acid-binding protein
VPPDSLLLDACIAINLDAAGRADDIAKVLNIRFLMVPQAAREFGEIRIEDEVSVVSRRIDDGSEHLVAEVVSLTDAEVVAYVELARDIDDGEAATVAVARARSLTMATDDRKARRVINEIGLPAPINTTTLLHDYSTTGRISRLEIGEMLRRIRDHANYIPRHADHNYAWWMAEIGNV